jgi:hypothetical protein
MPIPHRVNSSAVDSRLPVRQRSTDELLTPADNYASIRAIEKAGFHREGTLRAHCKTHGERHDCVMFSLVATDMQPN